MGGSHGPVQLPLGDGELAAVGLGVGPASLVAPRVAEDPAREYDEAGRGGLEVHIPAGLVKNGGEGPGELVCLGFVCFEVQQGPDVGLVAGGVPGPEPADLADGQRQVLQVRADAEALRDESAPSIMQVS